MQNKCNNGSRETGFVTLDGSWGAAMWNCGSCGCCNHGCETCSSCGRRRCDGAQGCGAAVYTRDDAHWNRGCDGERRSTECECGKQKCADRASCGERSQKADCCGENTRVRDLADEGGKGCGGRDNCPRRDSGCDRCEGGDGCRNRRNKGVGMVWAVKQELDQIFESESALRAGTLFPELHKPMNGYCPGRCNCQTDERAAAFAAWELRLYLNTHPCDKQALALFRRLCAETKEPNYATSFLKDMDCHDGWDWTDDPWPWECRPCGK